MQGAAVRRAQGLGSLLPTSAPLPTDPQRQTPELDGGRELSSTSDSRPAGEGCRGSQRPKESRTKRRLCQLWTCKDPRRV